MPVNAVPCGRLLLKHQREGSLHRFTLIELPHRNKLPGDGGGSGQGVAEENSLLACRMSRPPGGTGLWGPKSILLASSRGSRPWALCLCAREGVNFQADISGEDVQGSAEASTRWGTDR